jgi:hypothetical protein
VQLSTERPKMWDLCLLFFVWFSLKLGVDLRVVNVLILVAIVEFSLFALVYNEKLCNVPMEKI